MARPGYTEKKIPNLWPIYASGIVFLLYSLLSPIYMTKHFFIGIALAALTYVIGNRLAPAKVIEVETKVDTGRADANELIVKARATCERLRIEADGMTNEGLKANVLRTEQALTNMVDAVVKTPEKATTVSKFVNFYLPTTMKLLDAYDRLSASGDERSLNAIENSMANVADATERQYAFMFRDEYLDISTDIQVLEGMLKADGLLEGDPFGGSKSKLVL